MWKVILGFSLGKHDHNPIDEDDVIYIPTYFLTLEKYGSILDVSELHDIVFDKCYVHYMSNYSENVI